MKPAVTAAGRFLRLSGNEERLANVRNLVALLVGHAALWANVSNPVTLLAGHPAL